MSARLWTAFRGHGSWQAGVAALLSLCIAHRRARADEQSVTVACLQLDREGVAELESLARSAMLASNLRASIVIACQPEGVLVTAQSAEKSANVWATPGGSTFRDGVVAAVDAALEQLRPRKAPSVPAPASEVSQSEPEATTPPAARPEAAPPLAPEPKPAPPAVPIAPTIRAAQQTPRRAGSFYTDVYGDAGLEAWSTGVAGTARLGARHGSRYLRLGIRGGMARPLARDRDFTTTELSLTLEAVLVSDPALGLRATLAAGPSLLVVSPSERVTAVNDAKTAALVVAAEVSRPVWLGRFAVVPTLGVRVFGSQRGVRLDGTERLVLAGYRPGVTLGLAYQLD